MIQQGVPFVHSSYIRWYRDKSMKADKIKLSSNLFLLGSKAFIFTLIKKEVDRMVKNSDKWLNPNMSRRTFVKSSAITTAAVGAVVVDPWGSAMKMLATDHSEITNEDEEKIISSVCRSN